MDDSHEGLIFLSHHVIKSYRNYKLCKKIQVNWNLFNILWHFKGFNPSANNIFSKWSEQLLIDMLLYWAVPLPFYFLSRAIQNPLSPWGIGIMTILLLVPCEVGLHPLGGLGLSRMGWTLLLFIFRKEACPEKRH